MKITMETMNGKTLYGLLDHLPIDLNIEDLNIEIRPLDELEAELRENILEVEQLLFNQSEEPSANSTNSMK